MVVDKDVDVGTRDPSTTEVNMTSVSQQLENDSYRRMTLANVFTIAQILLNHTWWILLAVNFTL